MSNPWSRFKSLTPDPVLLVGTVQAHMPGDRSRVLLPSGQVIYAAGTGVDEGARAWVRDGKIEGEAPTLETVEIEV